MNPLTSPPEWITRLLRVAGAVLLGAALAIWVTPVNALGRNLVPVGCGSPATPDVEPLADFVCRDHIAGGKAMAVSLAVSAAVILLLSEVVLSRLRGRPWAAGVALASVLAVPVFALSVSPLFIKVVGSSADGTLIRCGTPLAPSTDKISESLCGQLAGRQKSLSLAGAGLSLLALLGAGYVANGSRREEPLDDDESTDSPGDMTGPAPDSVTESGADLSADQSAGSATDPVTDAAPDSGQEFGPGAESHAELRSDTTRSAEGRS